MADLDRPTAPPAAARSSLKGIAYTLAGCVFFAAMAGLIRQAGDAGVHPLLIVFFRNFFSLLLLAPWLIYVGATMLRTRRLGLYSLRAVFGVTSMFTWFTAITLMPLAEVMSLSFTAPFFVTILAALVLGEKVRARRWTAVALGFLGALIVLRPGSGTLELIPALLALASAVTTAGSTVCAKTLARTEPPDAIVAYLMIFLTPISLIPALFVWEWLTWAQYGWLFLVGLTGTLGHLLWTRAIWNAEASLVVSFDFVRLILVAAIGYFVFDQPQSAWTWAGGAVIVASAVYIARREAVAMRRAAKP